MGKSSYTFFVSATLWIDSLSLLSKTGFCEKIIHKETPIMQRFSSIFSQLPQLFPRTEFELAVKKHQSDYSAKGFSSWGQFIAMLFCQFARAHSLREICGGLASCTGKLKHLGTPNALKRSTL
jgi:hypothetical protein